jgi:hypothetical protein
MISASVLQNGGFSLLVISAAFIEFSCKEELALPHLILYDFLFASP